MRRQRRAEARRLVADFMAGSWMLGRALRRQWGPFTMLEPTLTVIARQPFGPPN